ncbi:hypothetical protein IQ263_12415 [Tychonema sp. LEGE 06208]|nr:hypothetical protein [Tychonema sp. LEGE 06208]
MSLILIRCLMNCHLTTNLLVKLSQDLRIYDKETGFFTKSVGDNQSFS